MTIFKNATMLTFNLAKTKHENWFEFVGNGPNVKTYLVSTLHNLVKAIFQSIRYRMFLKSELRGNGPFVDELVLRSMQWSNDPKKSLKQSTRLWLE
jgi:hypothetical protein